MDEHEQGALEHGNFIGYLTGAATCGSNLVIERTAGVVTVLTGLPMQLFNQVLVEDDAAEADGIGRGVELARARGVDFVLHLRDGVDDRFEDAARAAGLVSTGSDDILPGMAWLPLRHDSGVANPLGFDVHVVTDEAGVADHMDTITKGFGTPPSIAPNVMCVDLARRPGWTVYVGYEEGRPVCTGLGLRTGRTIGVYNIATIESARRKGYGEAMTARVVADGVAAGCDVAILQASDMGRPIYERMGFREVVRYVGWVDPGR